MNGRALPEKVNLDNENKQLSCLKKMIGLITTYVIVSCKFVYKT